jgi:hypothetical protein
MASFKEIVYAWRDGSFYQNIVKPVADACTRFVNSIVALFKK